MLGEHLQLMVGRRMWLVVVTVVMIAVIWSIAVIVVRNRCDLKVIEMRFRKEMITKVIDVNDEESRNEKAQPPHCRSWPRHPRSCLASNFHQFLLSA